MQQIDPSYFLISVSNRRNLELCINHALAGFTNSINGLWTFLDISEGDYISFLYGARVKNLYKVERKIACKNAGDLGPWPPVTFRMSGKTYYFPFRLFLRQEREFDEPMVRPEFSYVAENLLLRGGYRKTHFQADRKTLSTVSEIGRACNHGHKELECEIESFEPKIVFKRNLQCIPEKFYFQEVILQSLLRRRIKASILEEILTFFSIDISPGEFEILGEKALPEGYVDIFIKQKYPAGLSKFILAEVKTGKVQKKELAQLKGYLSEFAGDSAGALMIAREFPKMATEEKEILFLKYSFDQLDRSSEYTYEQLLGMLKLEIRR